MKKLQITMRKPSKTEPRFRQIANSLKHLILTEELIEHAPLPSERIVAEDYNVGRMTARRALETLEAEGLVYSKDRLGRFVSPQRMIYNVSSMENFIENAVKDGTPVESIFLGAYQEDATKSIASFLNIPIDEPVIRTVRLFQRDGHTLFVESETVQSAHYSRHFERTPKISKENTRFSVLGTTADIKIKMRSLTSIEAEALGVMFSQIGIEQEQIVRQRDGTPVCYTSQIWRGEMVQFSAVASLTGS